MSGLKTAHTLQYDGFLRIFANEKVNCPSHYTDLPYKMMIVIPLHIVLNIT